VYFTIPTNELSLVADVLGITTVSFPASWHNLKQIKIFIFFSFILAIFIKFYLKLLGKRRLYCRIDDHNGTFHCYHAIYHLSSGLLNFDIVCYLKQIKVSFVTKILRSYAWTAKRLTRVKSIFKLGLTFFIK